MYIYIYIYTYIYTLCIYRPARPADRQGDEVRSRLQGRNTNNDDNSNNASNTNIDNDIVNLYIYAQSAY